MRRVWSCVTALVISSTGCKPTPETINFREAPPGRLFSTDALALPELVVHAANGEAISPTPTIDFSADPPGVLLVQGRDLVALRSGEAVLRATVRGTSVSTSHSVKVTLVDQVKVRCKNDPCGVELGSSLELSVEALSGGKPIEDIKAVWSSLPTGKLKLTGPGMFLAASAGLATVQASVGQAKGQLEVAISPPLDALRIACPEPNLKDSKKVGERECHTKQAQQISLSAVATGGGSPVYGAKVEWVSDDPSVAFVNPEGLLRGLAVGRTTVSAKSGKVSTSLEVFVDKGCLGKPTYGVVQVLRNGEYEYYDLVCTDSAPGHCIEAHPEMELDAALEFCCCQFGER